jgi:hypothetical protein
MRLSHLTEPPMRDGGSLFTMTYFGSQMVVKNYNVMASPSSAGERHSTREKLMHRRTVSSALKMLTPQRRSSRAMQQG